MVSGRTHDGCMDGGGLRVSVPGGMQACTYSQAGGLNFIGFSVVCSKNDDDDDEGNEDDEPQRQNVAFLI